MAKKTKQSKKSYEAIDSLLDKLSDEDIATQTGEGLELVRQRRAGLDVRKNYESKSDLLGKLRAKHYWKTILARLIPSEIEYFENEWLSLYDQFSHDSIVHTDEMQMVDLITAQIFINRNLARRKDCMIEIEKVQNWLSREQDKPIKDQDLTEIGIKRQTLPALYAAIESLSREQENYEDRKDKIFKSLKSTRDQRLKQVEDRSKNFFGLIQYLDQRDIRKREGDLLGLVSLSTEKTINDFSQVIQYGEEGSDYDSPFLDEDTMRKQEDNNAES